MRGEQLDGQVRFYEDRFREASQVRLARQARRYRAIASAWQERGANKRSSFEQATCSLPLVRRAIFCQDTA